ncbi:hypothetical protein [Scytonema sp. NUACC26]
MYDRTAASDREAQAVPSLSLAKKRLVTPKKITPGSKVFIDYI